MTTADIATATGKTERTIRNWITSLAEINAVVAEKIAASTSMHPADYDLTETIAIIEKGMGKNAAEIWKENATRNAKPSDSLTRSDLADFGKALVKEVMQQFLPILQNRPAQIEFVQDYYTIKGYASKLGVQITYSDAIGIGREAAKTSRSRGIEIRKADDERFGQVGSYHVDVLKEVFQP